MSEEKLVAKISADATQLNQTVDIAASKVKEIGKASKEAANESVASSLKMSAAMGAVKSAAMAAVAAVKIIIQTLDQWKTAATEALMNLAGKNLGSVLEVNDRQIGKWIKAQEELKKYYELAKKNAENPTQENDTLLRQSRKTLSGLGFEINENDENLIDTITDYLNKAQEQRIKALKNKIEGLNGANETLQDEIKKERGLTAGSVNRINRLQSQIDRNAEQSRALQEQLHEAEKEQIGTDWRRMSKAKEYDAAEKKKEEQAKQELEEGQKALKAREEQQAKLKKAQDDLAKATAEEAKARKAVEEAQQKLAREEEAEAMANRRDRLAKAIDTYGFKPYEGFKADETGLERIRRRRQHELDASIADKMARQYEGQRVHYTTRERARIAERESLVKEDKNIEAAQNQISAAEKQKQASDSIAEAASKFSEASQRVTDYTSILSRMQTALDNMAKNTYIVK